MKKEEWFTDDGKIIRKKTTDPTAALDRAALLRSNNMTGFGENWHVGSIDMHVLEAWMKEDGITFDDRPAVQECIRKRLLSNEFNKFRVHEGTF